MIGLKQTARGVRPKTLQKGIREYLCCLDCEKLFNDRYEKPSEALWKTLATGTVHGSHVLERRRTPEGNPVLRVTGFNYDSFKLFLLLNLWRASIADGGEYADVSLGPHEDAIRKMILRGDPGDQYLYPCVVFLVRDSLRMLSSFTRVRYEAHTTYQIAIANVALWYFISSHTKNEPMTGASISSTGVLDATIMHVHELPFYRLAVEEARRHATSKR